MAQPAPGIAPAIRAVVGGKIEQFYEERGYWPLWIRNGTLGSEAERLIQLVESAELDGLNPDDYRADDLRAMVAAARGGSAEMLAKAEVKLSQTFARYVRDVRRSPAVSMTFLDEELEPKRLSDVAVLRAAAVAPVLGDYIATAGWMSPFYTGLRALLADYQKRWSGLPDTAVPPGPVLRAGASGERVRLLRRRLGLPDGAHFDDAVDREVRAFQAVHGLPADGRAGAATIAALNRGPAHYARLIRLNLERARALPGPGTRHIVVDAAAARLWAYADGKAQDTMRVVVGTPDQPTPMLAGTIRYVVLNPYWNVPVDLVRRRVAQKVLAGTSLRQLGFEALSDWTADARILDPAAIDWPAVAAGTRELRVRQLPGRNNAMGQMKFMFPNNLGIYLHDTPDKNLFGRAQRRFSSGCVRLEDAPRLARWLFGKPLRAQTTTPEQHVVLPAGVPVYITYLTAAPEKGGVVFRDDVYARDAPAMKHLASQ